MTIVFRDGELTIDFDKPTDAREAAASLLDALSASTPALDTQHAGWGHFTVEWSWFEPHGTVHHPERAKLDFDELDIEEYDFLVNAPGDWGGTPPDDPDLLELWAEWKARPWTKRRASDAEAFIEKACAGRYLTMLEIASLIQRSPDSVRVHHVNPMVHDGRLVKEYPNRRHPKQRYRTKPDRSES